MKKFPIALSVLMALSLTGCEYEEEAPSTQRDLYKTIDDCMADWDDVTLCSKVADSMVEQAKAASQIGADSNGNNGSTIVPVMLFYGPEYNSYNRTAYNSSGKPVTAKGNRSFKSSKPNYASSSYRSSLSKSTGKTYSTTPPSRSGVVGGSSRGSAGG